MLVRDSSKPLLNILKLQNIWIQKSSKYFVPTMAPWLASVQAITFF